jgi:hypothetical protein
MIETPYADKLEIRELIENWAIWRDSGDWQRFATVWHDDGWMSATWFQGPAADFIRVSQEGWSRGVRILHFLGGSNIEVVGSRAVVQTKMTISQRASVQGAWCDVVCTGRFFYFSRTEPVDGEWFDANPSTKRIVLIRSCPAQDFPWILTDWLPCPRAIDTWPISNRRLATK